MTFIKVLVKLLFFCTAVLVASINKLFFWLGVEPIAVEKSHIGGNYQHFVKLIRRLGTRTK